MSQFSRWRALLAGVLLSGAATAQEQRPHEHDELQAGIAAPYTAAADGTRQIGMELLHPGASGVAVAWQLQLVDADGNAVRRWNGEALAGDSRHRIELAFDDRDAHGQPLPHGLYTLQFTALEGDADNLQHGLAALQVDTLPARAMELPQIQEWIISVGPPPRAALAPFAALPVAPSLLRRDRGAELPYAVYYGNLHSQTNHSDGGGDLSTCNNAETPQAGSFGPAAAFAYADAHGLDFLMASEHNHMYDGRANGTNANATPQFANSLYAAGVAEAQDYSAAHPGFAALYGMEWGVTTDGGHLNIIGADSLYSWEYNGAAQLIGSFYTPRSDYAALYTFMRGQQVLGQFNHPATSGQFVIGGTALAYHADGDEVMVLAEVLNSSAFSVSTNEGETSLSSFEGAWKRLLERGFHIAPASNQDNHCANWGASYANRTAVLIPQDETLNAQSLHAALQARRVFATGDKTAQILLRAGEHLMGSRISNGGALRLRVDYASSSGRTASVVQIHEGVPGRNGTVSVAASAATATLNPAPGEHFYYAKITQDDGRVMWTAPIWVSQLAAGDQIFRDGFLQQTLD